MASGVLVVASIHRQQVPHLHGLQVLAWLCRRIIGEELEDRIVHSKQPLGHSQANRAGSEALTERVEPVWSLKAIGRPPALGGYIAVAQQHKALHGVEWMRMLFK